MVDEKNKQGEQVTEEGYMGEVITYDEVDKSLLGWLILETAACDDTIMARVFAEKKPHEGMDISFSINGVELPVKAAIQSLEEQWDMTVTAAANDLLEKRLSGFTEIMSDIEEAVRRRVRKAFGVHFNEDGYIDRNQEWSGEDIVTPEEIRSRLTATRDEIRLDCNWRENWDEGEEDIDVPLYVYVHANEELKCNGCGENISGKIGEGDDLLPRAYLCAGTDRGEQNTYCYNCLFPETENMEEIIGGTAE